MTLISSAGPVWVKNHDDAPPLMHAYLVHFSTTVVCFRAGRSGRMARSQLAECHPAVLSCVLPCPNKTKFAETPPAP